MPCRIIQPNIKITTTMTRLLAIFAYTHLDMLSNLPALLHFHETFQS